MRRSDSDGLETFPELVKRHQGLVFRTLARLIGRRDDLEDLAQEVFLRLFRALPHFRGRAKLSTFLYRIIVNVVNDEWLRRQKERQMVSIDEPNTGWGDRLVHPDADPRLTLERSRFLDALEAAMNQLDLRERTILTLYFQEEHSYQEIAAILDLPMGTVKTHLFRARHKLRTIMKEWIFSCKKPPRIASK